MSTTSTTVADALERPLDELDLGDMALWADGPPHAIFERLRKEQPIHWSEMAGWEGDAGFWSVTLAEDVHAVSRDWETYSSETGGVIVTNMAAPVEMQNAMFIGMDPPRHDRIKAIFQKGFTPKRIAAHEPMIREIACRVLDSVADRTEIDLVDDVAVPVVGRVIGEFMGTPEEDDKMWADLANRGLGFGDEELQPNQEAIDATLQEGIMKALAVAADRRVNPTDDLTSLLVHTEVDGERLEDHEVAMGFGLLVMAGNDSTKATYTNGMLALLRNREQMQKLIDDPEKIPMAVEEFLRMFPAFAHFRRTATRDTELNGVKIKEGDKVVMWYPSSNRDEAVYACPHQLDVERNAEHQAFGAGGRHFCLGTALARLELTILFEETLKRFPDMELVEEPEAVRSIFMNQRRAIRVRLQAAA